VRNARLFARVEPAHKSKIVSYLQADGEISAMVKICNCSELDNFCLSLGFSDFSLKVALFGS